MNLKKIFNTIFPENIHDYLAGTLYAFQMGIGIAIIITSLGLSNSWNPILSRTGYEYASHTLVWVIIGISIILIRLKTPWKNLKFAVYSLSAGLAMMGITEGIWQLSTFLYYNEFFWVTLSFNLEIIAMIVAFVLIGAYRMLDFKKFALYLSVLFAFFTIWIINGFNITLSFVSKINNGKSIYYNDLTTNAIEIMQWCVGTIGFVWAYKGRL